MLSVVYMLGTSSCSQQLKTIGEKEKMLRRLEKDCQRESARWDAMRGPENLDRALLRFGLSMRYPKAEQVVMMDGQGRPRPGQLSVARARQRAGKTVSYSARRRR
jgi:hypothetical protein